MPGRHDEPHGVEQQRHPHQPGVIVLGRDVGVLEDDGHVALPAQQHAHRLGRLEFRQPHVEAGWARAMPASAGPTSVADADGNAASRTRPARRPARSAMA